MLRVMTRRRPIADIAVDLGTARTAVVERGSGTVFDEPSLCCFRGYDAVPAFVAAGRAAERYVGRVSKPLTMVRPLHDGVVSDMLAARELIATATRPLRARRRFGRTRALFGAPADATLAERRALMTAAEDAGISDPQILPEPLLAAIGAGLEIDEARGKMVVDCGAGVTEAVVVSLGGICASGSVRGGGDRLTQAIADYLRTRRRFHVGFATAERVKLEVSRLLADGAAEASVVVRGLAASTGLPGRLEVKLAELAPLWERDLGAILAMVREVLAATPPELSHDVLEEGIWLTGGAACTALLAPRIERSTGVAARIAGNAATAVADGLAIALDGVA